MVVEGGLLVAELAHIPIGFDFIDAAESESGSR